MTYFKEERADIPKILETGPPMTNIKTINVPSRIPWGPKRGDSSYMSDLSFIQHDKITWLGCYIL